MEHIRNKETMVNLTKLGKQLSVPLETKMVNLTKLGKQLSVPLETKELW
jgi:hypothetical protein